MADCETEQQLPLPATDATVLASGSLGTLYSIPLHDCSSNQSETRPGENPVQYERTLQIGAPIGVDSALFLYRFKIWWMRPSWGRQAPPQTILLLDRPPHDDAEESSYRLLLAIPLPQNTPSQGFSSSSLRSEASNLVLCSNMATTGLFWGVGQDPYAIIRHGVDLGVKLWGDVRESSLSIPRQKCLLSKKLGWCTWNAFYTKVTDQKILDAVSKLRNEKGVPFHWIILDDGWQDTTTPLHAVQEDGAQWSHRLRSIHEHPAKFESRSLKLTIQRLKREYGIDKVLAWHTLAGYWLGLDPSTFESILQFPKFPRGIVENDWSATNESSVEKGIGIPISAKDFIQEYHNYLMDCGVDGVKVDAQGVMGVLEFDTNGTSIATGSAALQLQSALSISPLLSSQTAAGTIHCMAHAPEIFFGLPILSKDHSVTPLFRVADDFYPNNLASHSSQVVSCAFNSLLFREVACPDWDMFTTDLEERSVRMHAIARCISGGPIYLSDSPHTTVNTRVINWLCCSDGTTFPCVTGAVPAPCCLLRDPLNNDTPLILVNTNGTLTLATSIVLAIFRLFGTGNWDASKLDYLPSEDDNAQPTGLRNVELRKDDVCMLSDKGCKIRRYLCVCFFSGYAQIWNSTDNAITLDLGSHESEAVALLPLFQVGEHEIAFMGIEGKINGAGSVLSVDIIQDFSGLILRVCGCGTFSVILTRSIEMVTVELNGQIAPSQLLDNTEDCLGDEYSVKSSILSLGFSILQFEIPSNESETHVVVLCMRDHHGE